MTVTDPSDPHRDLAGVLHDVSNALTVLLGWVGEARAPGASTDDVAYALTIIEQRARIARDLSRHAIGGARIDEQREIGGVAGELARALKVEASRAGVRIVVRGGEVDATVAGALDVSQVLTNLVLNALAHAPKGSTVAIDVTASEDRCAIVVSDEGPGVSVSRRESIFAGDSQRPGGAGVGLRHSRALARAWGGDIELELGAGPGARFRVTWPRADTIPRPPTSTSRVQDLFGLRVLIVEDDVAVTGLLEAALEGRGAAVTIAPSATDLAAALARGPYDAALVDLSPIASDVTGGLSALRQSCPGARVVLITGSADAVPESVAEGEVDLVRKPFEVREIVAALKKARAR